MEEVDVDTGFRREGVEGKRRDVLIWRIDCS